MELDYSKLAGRRAAPSRRGGYREGSGREKRNTKTVIFRLSPDVIKGLHVVAKLLGCSMSGYVDMEVRKSLKKYLS
jgi:hypothetical protein